ncbi:MAG: potassium channel family protein [Acidobacteria bacterium]|nr:potassium channel family protein [Acidobacteriota bacterium]
MLALLLVLIVVEVGLDNRGLSPFLLDLSSAAILFIALVAATGERRHRRTAFALAALTVLLGGGGVLGFRPWELATGAVMSAVFAGYTTWRLLARVLRSQKVTGDVLAGALAAYILAGLSFALAFAVIESRWPGSLVVSDGRHASFPDLIYFSFVTLLTIGFGDVVPGTGPVRAVTLLEGLFGVVYTTVVMAALVAAYLGQRGSPLSPEPDEARVGVADRGRDDDAPQADEL